MLRRQAGILNITSLRALNISANNMRKYSWGEESKANRGNLIMNRTFLEIAVLRSQRQIGICRLAQT